MACFERCIRTENRPEGELRNDLSEWLQLVHPVQSQDSPPPYPAVQAGGPETVPAANRTLEAPRAAANANSTAVPTPSVHPLASGGTAPPHTLPASCTISTSTSTVRDAGSLLSQDLSSASVSLKKIIVSNVRETWDKSVQTAKDFRDATRKAAVLATNAQNKRFALLALHALRNLKNSSFGGVYRAALVDPTGKN